MYSCPQCHTTMSQQKVPLLGPVWTCPSCQGRAVTRRLLQRTIPKSLIDHLWQQARAHHHHTGRRCPACERPMAEVPLIPRDDAAVCLDVCTACHFVWFDPREFEALPQSTPRPSDLEGLSDEAKKALARAHLKSLKTERFTSEMGILGTGTLCQISLDILSFVIELLTGW